MSVDLGAMREAEKWARSHGLIFEPGPGPVPYVVALSVGHFDNLPTALRGQLLLVEDDPPRALTLLVSARDLHTKRLTLTVLGELLKQAGLITPR